MRDHVQRQSTIALGLIYAAILFGITILAYVIGSLNGHQSERREQTPAAYSNAAKQDAQRACVGRDGSATFECIYEKVESSQEQARAEQDLSAQQRAADSALASAIIALLTLFTTSLGVWYVKRTLDATLIAVKDTSEATSAMKTGNGIAQQQFKQAYAPVLYIEPLGPVVLDFYRRRREKGGYDVILQIENRGTGHARLIRFAIWGALNVFHEPRNRAYSDFELGQIIEPGQFSFLADRRAVAEAIEATNGDPSYIRKLGNAIMEANHRHLFVRFGYEPTAEHTAHVLMPFRGEVLYEDALGIRRIKRFAFQPHHGGTFSELGGSQWNNVTEVQDGDDHLTDSRGAMLEL